jgi:tripartite-type tricarboxylate transporter receptor subunit TctC
MIKRCIGALIVLCAACCLALPSAASASDYPTRPIHWVVAFPAGGSNDIVARLIGQALAERLGQPVIIENREGAGGNIGTQVALKAQPDGYTILFSAPHNAINAALYRQLTFDFLKDSTPIAGLARTPNVMEVNPAVPARTVREFIDYAQANPGKVKMASAGVGTAIHLSGEMFMAMTGVKMIHVPYRGGAPALADMMSGQVDVMFDNLPSSIGHIQAGALRALAVTTENRSAALPDLPTVAETVPGYEASIWYGVVAPKGVPAEIVEKLNKNISAILAEPQMQKRLADLGCTPMPMTATEFGNLLAVETKKWADVVKFSGANLD